VSTVQLRGPAATSKIFMLVVYCNGAVDGLSIISQRWLVDSFFIITREKFSFQEFIEMILG